MSEDSSGQKSKVIRRKRVQSPKVAFVLPICDENGVIISRVPKTKSRVNERGELILPVIEEPVAPLATDPPETRIKYLDKLSTIIPVSKSKWVRESHRDIYTNGIKFEKELWTPSNGITRKTTPTESQLKNTWWSVNKFEPLTNLVEDYQLLEAESVVPVDAPKPVRQKVVTRKRKQIEKIENLETVDIYRTRKLQFTPSERLRLLINKAFDVSRFIYNKCVDLWKENKSITEKELLSRLATNKSEESIWTNLNLKDEYEKVPSAIRTQAVYDFTKALNTQLNIRKKKEEDGKVHKFDMTYRLKKDKVQSICITKQSIRQWTDPESKQELIQIFPKKWCLIEKGYVKWFSIEKRSKYIKAVEEFFDFHISVPKIDEDCRMQMRKDGRYYLCVPSKINPEDNLKIKTGNIAALDPGIKSFQTVYGSNNVAYTIGDNVTEIDKLSRIAQRMRDGKKRIKVKGQKMIVQAKNRKEQKLLSHLAMKLEIKIKNKIDDLHKKTVKFLCDNYDTVIIPKFGSQQMVEKKDQKGNWKRNISKKSARMLLRLEHYKFRQLLIAKGEATGTKVIVGGEHLTSKTCTKCFRVKHELKVWDREHNCICGHKIDRDLGAARNIMLCNWEANSLMIPRKRRGELPQRKSTSCKGTSCCDDLSCLAKIQAMSI